MRESSDKPVHSQSLARALNATQSIWRLRLKTKYGITRWLLIQVNKLMALGHVCFELQREISNNMVYATSKGSDQPVHKRSLIRAFASRFNII